MIEEVDFMSKIIGGHASQPIDLNQIYIEKSEILSSPEKS